MQTFTKIFNRQQTCIDALNHCAQMCYESISQCLNETVEHSKNPCIEILLECARACQVTSASLAIGSKFSKAQCSLCASICDACAQECETYGENHYQQCADACYFCADECKRMSVS